MHSLKLAYVHLSVQKTFPGLYTRIPVVTGEGRQGKREGGIGRNGRKRMGRKER
jgi:hypothetical protein